jgi:hypothetical protein
VKSDKCFNIGKNCNSAEFLFLRIVFFIEINLNVSVVLATFEFEKRIKYEAYAFQSVFKRLYSVFQKPFTFK